VTAALLEPLGVAIHALDLARVRPMDTVAVLGAGCIGLLLMQVARASGAGRIFVIDPLRHRAAVARSLNADNMGANHEAILDWTNGRGVDITLEATNSPEGPHDAVSVTRIGGKVVLVGIPNEDSFSLPASLVRRKGLTLKFSRRMGSEYQRAIQMVQLGHVQFAPLVTHRFSLDRAPEAFALLDTYGDGVVKLVITAE